MAPGKEESDDREVRGSNYSSRTKLVIAIYRRAPVGHYKPIFVDFESVFGSERLGSIPNIRVGSISWVNVFFVATSNLARLFTRNIIREAVAATGAIN